MKPTPFTLEARPQKRQGRCGRLRRRNLARVYPHQDEVVALLANARHSRGPACRSTSTRQPTARTTLSFSDGIGSAMMRHKCHLRHNSQRVSTGCTQHFLTGRRTLTGCPCRQHCRHKGLDRGDIDSTSDESLLSRIAIAVRAIDTDSENTRSVSGRRTPTQWPVTSHFFRHHPRDMNHLPRPVGDCSPHSILHPGNLAPHRA